MKRKLLSLLLAAVTLLMPFPAHAINITLSTGDIMMITGAAQAPLYASSHIYDNTVMTYIPFGKTVMYIGSVDRGFCVAYENFLGYVDEYLVTKVSDAYGFPLPDGSAFKAISSSAGKPENTVKPGNPGYVFSGYTSVAAFPYSAKFVLSTMDIATRTGPGTKYTSPGTFPKYMDYTAFYQTKGGSVNWAYVEFEYREQKYRLYTGVKRFNIDGYLDYCTEPESYVTITRTHHTYYGPGYDYAQSEFEPANAGQTVKALFAENGWVMIEYTLKDGSIHRGWSPNGYWY